MNYNEENKKIEEDIKRMLSEMEMTIGRDPKKAIEDAIEVLEFICKDTEKHEPYATVAINAFKNAIEFIEGYIN